MRFFRLLKIVLLTSTVFMLGGCRKTMLVNNAIIYLVNLEQATKNIGRIEGESWQSVTIGEYSKEVTAISNNPSTYRFSHWSDGNTEPTRKDLALNSNNSEPIYYYAYFEAIN